MKNRELFLTVLVVALSLGTAWAIRGRFGHEQGAAWAGAIGAVSVILVARRADWYEKVFKIAMAAAFGWGISGMMSYGIIVGYGRGTDFINVYYGLLMLFVIGVLYGFLGGGLFGLSLLSSKQIKIPWHTVLVEMIAVGLLTYAVLINQLEWFMTPPRSEMWAACLGASIALGWFLVRNEYYNVLKVAVCSALGAGFGFAFGNFLQVMGGVSGLEFNFWNVMEYSIGFFGGIGMAYGTFTSEWPSSRDRYAASTNLIPILFVTLFVPFVVWDQSFVTDRFEFITASGGSATMIRLFQGIAITGIITVAAYFLWCNYSDNSKRSAGKMAHRFFVLYLGLYILLSFLITGTVVHPLEQYLYVLNFIAILYLISKTSVKFSASELRPRAWGTATLMSILFIAILALIAINSHEGLRGSNVRF